MSLVDTLETVLLPSSKSSSSSSHPSSTTSPVRVYTRGLRYGLGTQVISGLGIYSSAESVYHGTEQALDDVDAGWEGEGADVVVLATCEME
jgi:hypothetical protein